MEILRQKTVMLAVIGMALLSASLYSINTHTFYHRVQIVVDSKVQTEDTYQLFYDTGNGFNEQESLQARISSSNEIQSTIFTLPVAPTRIIGFRLDTGSITKEIEIEKISLKTKQETFSWGPQEILAKFSGQVDYSLKEVRNNMLHLETTGNDPQLVYTGILTDKIDVIDTEKNTVYSLLFVLFYFGIGTILYFIRKETLFKIIQEQKRFMALFFLSFIVYVSWLMAFFPGTMSFDSISIWGQAGTGIYDNAHPFINSVLTGLLRHIWDSPAIIALFQICVTSFILAYSLVFFEKQGVSKTKTMIVFVIFLIMPSIGVYNVTLWKDVLFAQLITFLSILFIKHYRNKEEVKNIDVIFVGFLTVLIANIRHNGVLYLLFLPLIYFLFKIITTKKLMVLVSSIGLFYIFFNGILFTALNVTNYTAALSREFVRLQVLGNSLQKGYSFTEKNITLIEQVMPVEEFQARYNCTAIDYIRINNSPIRTAVFSKKQFASEFNTMIDSLIVRHPRYFFSDRICLFSSLIGLGNIQLQYLYHPKIDMNAYGIQQSPNKHLHAFFDSYLTWSTKSPQRFIFWFHLTYILVYGYFFVQALQRKKYDLLGFILLVGINIPILFFFGVARDFRYLYMIQFALPFLFLIDAMKNRIEK